MDFIVTGQFHLHIGIVYLCVCIADFILRLYTYIVHTGRNTPQQQLHSLRTSYHIDWFGYHLYLEFTFFYARFDKDSLNNLEIFLLEWKTKLQLAKKDTTAATKKHIWKNANDFAIQSKQKPCI